MAVASAGPYANRPRQITMPAPHHSVFLTGQMPSCHPTNSDNALETGKHYFNMQYFVTIYDNAAKIYELHNTAMNFTLKAFIDCEYIILYQSNLLITIITHLFHQLLPLFRQHRLVRSPLVWFSASNSYRKESLKISIIC